MNKWINWRPGETIIRIEPVDPEVQARMHRHYIEPPRNKALEDSMRSQGCVQLEVFCSFEQASRLESAGVKMVQHKQMPAGQRWVKKWAHAVVFGLFPQDGPPMSVEERTRRTLLLRLARKNKHYRAALESYLRLGGDPAKAMGPKGMPSE